MEIRPQAIHPAAALNTRAQLERISEPWALNRTLAIAVTLVLAVVLGGWAASGQIENLILVAVWFAAVMIIVFVQDHWWSPALVITAAGLQTYALDFPLSGLEIGMVILALTFPVKMAMKTLRKAEPEMDHGVFYWLLLAFVCTHAVSTLFYEKIEGAQLKNIVRAYYNALTPLIFYGLLIRYCYARTVKPAAIAIYVATSVSVFFSVITLLVGIDIEPLSELKISIDWLNELGALGGLRVAPVYLFLGSLAYWPAARSALAKVVLSLTLALGLIGVLIGGGRISLATCLLGSALIALLRNRLWMVLVVTALTGAVAGAITIAPDILYSMPDMAQRALAPLNFSDRQTEMQQTLVASNEWHENLRNGSYAYWTADTVSFWVGHGFKAWDATLNTSDGSTDVGDYDRRVELAIEMGKTENTFSSITNIFGLVGLILYGSLLINLARQLWKAVLACPKGSPARALSEFSLVNVLAFISFFMIMGGTPGINLIFWQLGLLAARPYICKERPPEKLGIKAPHSFIPADLQAKA